MTKTILAAIWFTVGLGILFSLTATIENAAAINRQPPQIKSRLAASPKNTPTPFSPTLIRNGKQKGEK